MHMYCRQRHSHTCIKMHKYIHTYINTLLFFCILRFAGCSYRCCCCWCTARLVNELMLTTHTHTLSHTLSHTRTIIDCIHTHARTLSHTSAQWKYDLHRIKATTNAAYTQLFVCLPYCLSTPSISTPSLCLSLSHSLLHSHVEMWASIMYSVNIAKIPNVIWISTILDLFVIFNGSQNRIKALNEWTEKQNQKKKKETNIIIRALCNKESQSKFAHRHR